jgi:hypothetical protein
VARLRPSRKDSLARELRANRPGLSEGFVDALSKRVDAGRRSRLHSWSRVSFAGALTVLVLGSLASFGGLSYAASGTKQAVKTVRHAVAPSRPQIVQKSAAQAQYGQPRVTICHKGRTITVSQAAVPAHLRHGDTVGACGGVAGATAERTAGGVLGSSASGGTLPFTGISLGVTVLLALLLVSLGLALRRRADRKS